MAVLEMNSETDIARERLLDQALGATTLPEITDARVALRDWLTLHPQETGMADGFEQLANMEEIAEDSTLTASDADRK